MKTSTLGFLMITTVVLCASIAAVSGAYRLDAQQVVQVALQAGMASDAGQNRLLANPTATHLAALLLGAALAGAGTTYQECSVTHWFRRISSAWRRCRFRRLTAILLGLPILFIQLYAFTGGLLWSPVSGVYPASQASRSGVNTGAGRIAWVRSAAREFRSSKRWPTVYPNFRRITFWLLGGLSTILCTICGSQHR